MLCPILTFAHSGGHYHHGDGTVYNTWQLKNGTPLKGNFLMNKGDVIYLEKENGKKRFMIKGKMFLFDPMKHESGIVNDKKCLCKKDLTLDDLENHIDFIL